MKTTIELPDALLDEAKQVAQREGTTLKELIDHGLRAELARRSQPREFTLRDASFRGRGLRQEFADAGWDRIREAAYEGHGS